MLGVGIGIPNLVYHAAGAGATVPQATFLFTIYSLLQFALAPAWGRLSDRIGRKPVLLAGLVGNAAGLALFASAHGLTALYAARALSGAMSSAALPTAMAYVADVTDEGARGRAMGRMGAAMGLGFIFGPAIGGALSQFGTALPFFGAAALNLITAGLAAALLRESLGRGRPDAMAEAAMTAGESPVSSDVPVPEPPVLPHRPDVPRRLLPFYMVAFFVAFAMAALESIFPWYIRDTFGFGPRDMGFMFLFMGVAVFLMQAFVLGRWIAGSGEQSVLVGGLWINAIGFLLVIAAAGRVALTAALVVGGVGNQIMRPTNASLISKRSRGGKGVAIGIMNSFDSAGRMLGPIAAGALYGPDRRLPYVVSAAILIAVGAGLWRASFGRDAGAPPAIISSRAP